MMVVKVWFSSATRVLAWVASPVLRDCLRAVPKEGLQGLGVGPAVDPGVVGLVGVLNLWRHDVSFLGQLPWLCVWVGIL